MEKQDSREKELLEQIKFCLECKNENQAIRLIEKYGYEQKEINIIQSYEEGLKYTDDEVIELLDNFRNSQETNLIKWFNLNKKNNDK
jgi:hypothetical protein